MLDRNTTADLSATARVKARATASIWFLDELELYKTVKPYRLNFPSDDPSVPRSNFQRREIADVPIHDIRDLLEEGEEEGSRGPSYDEHGFTVIQVGDERGHDRDHESSNGAAGGLTLADCEDVAVLRRRYLDGMTAELARVFGTPHVEVLRYQTRVRHASFPLAVGENYAHKQPVLMAHVDWTPEKVAHAVRQRKGGSDSDDDAAAESILRGRVAVVHVWRPLRGPVRDWPLALCDASSVRPAADLEAADSVARSGVDENYQVYHRPAHRWFYLSGQRTHEALVFRQHDSKFGRGSGVPHAAIRDPDTPDGAEPRESIEVQVLLYWDDDDDSSF